MLTSSRPPSATLPSFGADFPLSPVVTEPGKGSSSSSSDILGLCDGLGRELTLCYRGGTYLRVTLPTVGGHLVTSALEALSAILPRSQVCLIFSYEYFNEYVLDDDHTMTAFFTTYISYTQTMYFFELPILGCSSSLSLSGDLCLIDSFNKIIQTNSKHK